MTFRGIGTIANLATVLAGGLVGWLLGNRLPQRMVDITMQTVGLATLLIGLQMAWEASSGSRLIAVLISVVIGSWIGEALKLDDRLNSLGDRLKQRFGRHGGGDFTRGFVTASLLFCVGPMTVLGALQDGLRGDPTLLFTKSTLDGISAIALTAGLGPGVLLSSVTIVVYQGGLTLGAGLARQFLTDPVVALLTAAGGLMILGLGLNILQVARLRVANMLPGLVIATCAGLLFGGLLA